MGAKTNPADEVRHWGQATFGKRNNTPTDPSAILDLGMPGTNRGLLLPRTTPGNIESPAEGLLIYNTDTDRIEVFNGEEWIGFEDPDLIDGGNADDAEFSNTIIDGGNA